MGGLETLFQPRGDSASPQVLACTVTRPPADANGTCTVETDSDGQDHDGVHFQPRGDDLPARGDKGVVLMDENGQAAALIWWPA